MTIDMVIALGTFLISIVAIVISLRKSRAEIRNLDADTISDLQESLNKVLKDYNDLVFKVAELQKEIACIKDENIKLRRTIRNLEIHIRALVEQLLKAGITPVTVEQALEIWKKGDRDV